MRTIIVIRMSELFRGGDTLMIYHYMFPLHSGDERPGPTSGAMATVPLTEGPCPSCTALIDMWDGAMPHFEGLGGNLVIAARAPITRVAAFARDKAVDPVRSHACWTPGGRRADGLSVLSRSALALGAKL